jgi:hypothetical protein
MQKPGKTKRLSKGRNDDADVYQEYALNPKYSAAPNIARTTDPTRRSKAHASRRGRISYRLDRSDAPPNSCSIWARNEEGGKRQTHF